MLSLKTLDQSFAREVNGINLTRPTKKKLFGYIEKLLNEHPVLIFRNQNFDANALDAFAREFGKPKKHVLLKYRPPIVNTVSYVRNIDGKGKIDPFGNVRATSWHTDATYEKNLPRLAMLHALEVPSSGGGTIFADMRAAYDDLSPSMKKKVEHLTGIHKFNVGPGAEKEYLNQPLANEYEDQFHPVVAIHPYSFRQILFINPSHTYSIKEMKGTEACQLIKELWAHSVQSKFLYHHVWMKGDLLIWDEMATMHRNAGDVISNERRVLLRSIVYPPDNDTIKSNKRL